MEIYQQFKNRVANRLLASNFVKEHVNRSILHAYPSSHKIGDFKEDDVFIVGYPKSGNTWMQYLLSGVVYGLHGQNVTGQLVQELIPDVHYKNYYQRFGGPAYFKSHHLPRQEYQRVIYIVRDGRDVLVSFWHYHKNLTGSQLDYDKLIQMPIYQFGTWSEHVLSWMDNTYGAQLMCLRYEDLLLNGASELNKVARFLGLEIPEKRLKEIVRDNSFKVLQEKERLYGFGRRLWNGGGAFFRRGVAAGFVDEMPADLVQIFTEQNANALDKFNYLDPA